MENVFACLASPSHEVTVDLVRNLRGLDPSSQVLLYEGSGEAIDTATRATLHRLGAFIHPTPRHIRHREHHLFAFDCLSFAVEHLSFDTLTFVDARQLCVRPAWSERLAAALGEHGSVGLLGAPVDVHPASTRVASAIAAWQELSLWEPLLERFEEGRKHFVRWTRWPGMVITEGAARELLHLRSSEPRLMRIVEHSRLWSLAEVLFPTLTGLLGFELLPSPDPGTFVLSEDSVEPPPAGEALADPDAYWIYPIAASYSDPDRAELRRYHQQYRRAKPLTELPSAPDELIYPGDEIFCSLWETTSQVKGWLTEAEAKLLASATQTALHECPESDAVVEVGSYCGRGTTVLGTMVREIRPTARVWAIDSHDGFLGALDRGLEQFPPSLASLEQTLEAASLKDYVHVVQSHAPQVAWSRPIALLWLDGLHDYPNVARDFLHFEPWLAEGALVALHDYSHYFSGVMAFVDELPRDQYQAVARAHDLIVLRRTEPSAERFVPSSSEVPAAPGVSLEDAQQLSSSPLDSRQLDSQGTRRRGARR